MLNSEVIRTPATRAFRVWTAAMCIAATGLVAAAGQSGPATLSGSVVDPTGAPIPDVTVSLTNKTTNARFEVKTDNAGRFEFVPLPADEYQVKVAAMGFKAAEDSVRLAGKPIRRDLTLAVGTVTETINVVGEPGGASTGARRNLVNSVDVDAARRRFEQEIDSCQASPTGGRIRPPHKLKDVRPVYPESLVSAGVGGTVVLAATIGADGNVANIEVVKAVHPELDASAIEAVRQWQFDGTLLNCKPMEVSMTVSITFNAK